MESRFNLSSIRSIIIYDLENNDVSAEQIVSHSKELFIAIQLADSGRFNLPNTTIKANLDRENAKKEFLRAFSESGSKSKIKRLFICEIKNKDGYIFEV